jgi:hypothetical protein
VIRKAGITVGLVKPVLSARLNLLDYFVRYKTNGCCSGHVQWSSGLLDAHAQTEEPSAHLKRLALRLLGPTRKVFVGEEMP